MLWKEGKRMNNLVKVIGLAPSELPEGEFLEKLLKERQRSINSLILFRTQPKKTKKGKKAKPKQVTQTKKADAMRALEAKAAEMGLSVEDMMKKLVATKEAESESK